jgi:hypothetical protein
VTTAIDRARAVADAVLYEGYLLYPYRASATKNKVRWQWGVLMPPSYADGETGEHSWSRTELLAEPADGATLHVRLRFLQLQRRLVQVGADHRPVASVTVGGVEHTTWEEAVEREVDAAVPMADLLAGAVTIPVDVPGGEDMEPFDGGRLVRRREPLAGELRLRAEPLEGPFGGVLLRLVVANVSTGHGANRDEALRHALIAAHTLLSLSAGHFLSATAPPEWASVATAECRSERAWPVLMTGDDTVLCTPIILPDHPEIAEQSAGNLFDGTEIDEILTLRTMTLTDEEKRQARATDARAAELIDRVDHLPPELLDRLHGTLRYVRAVTGEPEPDPEVPWWDPGADASMSPETDTVLIDGVAVGKGTRVRLRPGKRADAHDMFLAGRTAVVQAVLLDVDDQWHLAVTVDDDLGADLYAAHGRYRYFGVDEVEPI